MSDRLPIGQRIRVHSLTVGGSICDQDATVKGYTQAGEMLVRFDIQRYDCRLPEEWTFDLLPGEPVSHWQVWIVTDAGERLLEDNFQSPLPAQYLAKQKEREYDRIAARHDDWVPPPKYEVRAVPIQPDAPTIESEVDISYE